MKGFGIVEGAYNTFVISGNKLLGRFFRHYNMEMPNIAVEAINACGK